MFLLSGEKKGKKPYCFQYETPGLHIAQPKGSLPARQKQEYGEKKKKKERFICASVCSKGDTPCLGTSGIIWFCSCSLMEKYYLFIFYLPRAPDIVLEHKSWFKSIDFISFKISWLR